jgi:hypothetical protein
LGRRRVQQPVFVVRVQLEESAEQLPSQPADAGALVQTGGEINPDPNGYRARLLRK